MTSPKDGGSGLEPCPFCGEGVELGIDGKWRRANCVNDFCPVKPSHQTMSLISLRTEWNTRLYQAQAPAIEAVVEALRDAQDFMDDLGDLPLEKMSVERVEGTWNLIKTALAALAAVRGGSK